MRNVKLVLEYDGAAYHGWQAQRDPQTLQHVLEQAIARVTHERVRVHGSGRTDAGVHALGQVASFHTTSRIPAERLVHAINAHLPDDAAVKSARDVPESFHARYSAKGKHYRYTILNATTRSPLAQATAWWVRAPLDVEAMQRAAQHLVGTHDFRAFCTQARQKGETTRTVHRLGVRKRGRRITVDVEANGFLYNMVRAIVGTLVSVGRGQRKPAEVGLILKALRRSDAGPTAPPHGLCLVRVVY